MTYRRTCPGFYGDVQLSSSINFKYTEKKYIYSSGGIALNKLTVLTPGILMTQAGEKEKQGVEWGTGRHGNSTGDSRKEGKGSWVCPTVIVL